MRLILLATSSKNQSNLSKEQEVKDVSVWLKANRVSLALPNRIMSGKKQLGTLNLVKSRLMFIPSITWEEWSEIVKKHPLTPDNDLVL